MKISVLDYTETAEILEKELKKVQNLPTLMRRIIHGTIEYYYLQNFYKRYTLQRPGTA